MNMEGNAEPVPTQEKETGRIEAFSDGVIAIAITLLVLELRVPHVENEPGSPGLLALLAQDWPSHLAFLTSFFTILIMWVNHHRMFTFIKRADSTFMFLNGLLLLGISLVPFPTALLAEYIQHRDANVAALVYSGTFAVIAVFFNLLWRYAVHNMRLIDPRLPADLVHVITRQYRYGPLFYLTAFAASFFNAYLGFGICIIIAIYFIIPGGFGAIFRRG